VDQDFFMGHVVETGREYVWRRDPEFGSGHQKSFTDPFQLFRPVGETADFPLKSGGTLRGYWAFCRAGIDCESFSDDDLGLMRFCIAFMDDAFHRMLLPSPLDEDIAYLDYCGNIVGAGAKIQEAFAELFGRDAPLAIAGERAERRLAFLGRYRRFLAGPFAVGMDRATLSCGNRRYAFLFSLLRSADSQLRQEGIPFSSVRFVGVASMQLARIGTPHIEPDACRQFTPRELDVLNGIYAGKSNKEIAAELKVDEGTVKRHTHGIYEKTGFRSRVELVLGMPTP
jgi:DNA-binding CsgD family transcriptional regulator